MFSPRMLGFAAAVAVLTASAHLPMGMDLVGVAQASEIKYVVNNIPITSYDIQRRAAFIRLQRGKGNASDQMIEQTLRNAEAARLGIKVTDEQVDTAYARFAKDNKMPLDALDKILGQAGVTKSHFKEYIRSQMAWNQALGARHRSTGAGGGAGPGAKGGSREQNLVRQMLQRGGEKPKATEYMLQQVIFVVPAGQRGDIAKRKREAEAMRMRFRSCETTRSFAKGLIDVTVRDLGRVLEPQLPADWAEPIKATKSGAATPVRQTERGIEFIGICSAREVSDDRVAELVFQAESSKGANADELSKTYTQELREKAKIVER
ncbi:peptidylprolyl isomerase [Arvimicrobium flavum]|uniref:peptidylprolyl isomerase n=1 Tax=Arvimicrobium flavum TaxID=3393320 RepID=UPI00237B7689|nr:peptidylprolyl isomerase [Mesorhizobium shangrilense]